MANLTRTWRWEQFHPDLGENLDLPPKDRLTLRIASALPTARISDLRRDFYAAIVAAVKDERPTAEATAAAAEAFAVVFAGIVEVVGDNTIAGKPVATLAQYLAAILDCSGIYSLTELLEAVIGFNSLEGTQRLFSERHSGGLLSTRAQSAAKASEPKAAP
jgi:hypothetical protein